MPWIAGGLVALQLAAVVAGAYVYAWYSNSLEGSGRWQATKTRLERRVMGAHAFAQSCHTLSGERLDLGRWFGFQEVLLAEPIEVQRVEFDFLPRAGAHLSFLYGSGPDERAGLRLSTDPQQPSGRFRCANSGEFLEFEPLPDLAVPTDGWVHLAFDFGSEGVRASRDGEPPVRLGDAPGGPQRFGFRGGLQSVLVDDVIVRAGGGASFHERFFNLRGFLFALVALSGLVGLELFLWRVTRHDARLRTLLVAGGASLVFVALGALALHQRKAGTYPRLDRTAEAAWVAEEVERVDARIQAEYGVPRPERTRVLVVGTSQTWGAGAARAEEGFVEVLESELRSASPLRQWECINAGVSGLRAPRLVELLRERWLALEPDVLLVNLSNNDKDPLAFEEALEGFARLAEEHGIAALFALEANAVEYAPGELPLHPVMRRVAAAHRIPLVDVHRSLASHAQRGFLWWDNVHPTSFGHRLIAVILLPSVLELANS
jgi:lysophospholipase L1-like esterase